MNLVDINKDTFQYIMDTFIDFRDDGYNIKFRGLSSSVTYDDYYSNKNPRLDFTYNVTDKLISSFDVIFKCESYDKFNDLSLLMKRQISILSDDSWRFDDFVVKTRKISNNTPWQFDDIIYSFSKIVVIENGEFNIDNIINKISPILRRYSFEIEEYSDDSDSEGSYIDLSCYSDSQFDSKSVYKCIDDICNKLKIEEIYVRDHHSFNVGVIFRLKIYLSNNDN